MYLAVPPSKYQEFTRLGYAHQTVRFRDFGKIVRYGYADDVPAEIKEEMRIQYGYGDEHYWWRLDKEINAAQAAGFVPGRRLRAIEAPTIEQLRTIVVDDLDPVTEPVTEPPADEETP